MKLITTFIFQATKKYSGFRFMFFIISIWFLLFLITLRGYLPKTTEILITLRIVVPN